MRLRILVTAAAFVGFAGAGTLLARSPGACAPANVCCVERHACCDTAGSCCDKAESCCDKAARCCAAETTTGATQWSITNFVDAVLVNRTLVSGPVLIVHDDEKMARGEPCTTFYRFEPGVGQKEALVSFHCIPRRAEPVTKTTLTISTNEEGIKRLVEYQLGGDSEAHGVPR